MFVVMRRDRGNGSDQLISAEGIRGDAALSTGGSGGKKYRYTGGTGKREVE